MIALLPATARRLGVRASAYAREHASVWGRSRCALLPRRADATDGVTRTLDRIYGRARTLDRGEVEYWEIPLSDTVEVGS